MTKEQQSRIFDAFSQADVSVTRKYGGTGLGLTISSQFVELMGGELEVESVKDQGTSFFFTLPLEEVFTDEINYHNAFSAVTIGKYEQDIPTKLDGYLQKYFDYFGSKIIRFDSMASLDALNDSKQCKNYWVDIDNAKQNILDAIEHIDKSRLIVMANVTSRNKIEYLGLEQKNIIFKPVTLNKIKTVLNNTINIAPELLKNAKSAQEAKFDAKILVTEDNFINQKLIKRLLEERGITVELASNGLESFEKRRNGNYDLIFMDIQMPVMDGIEATHEILDFEKDEGLAHIPIVALTANALKGDRERFLAEGMDEYITKPIETSDLLFILNKFLHSKTGGSLKRIVINEVQNTIVLPPKEPISPYAPSIDLLPDEPLSQPTKESIQTALEKQSDKKILIAKRFLLSSRILTKMLDNMGLTYDVLNALDNIEESIETGKYDLLLCDIELMTPGMIEACGDIAIIYSDSLPAQQDISIKKGEAISNLLTKDELEKIIIKYRG